MATRMVLATVTLASSTVGFAAAQTPSTSPGAPNSSNQTIVAGCVARGTDGFFLRTTATGVGVRRRSGGSNSAKSSTPVSGGHAPIAARETVGSNSPKASTPHGTTTAGAGRRTGGVTTAKGSVPIVGGALPEITYELVADPDLLSSHAGHVVEIRGTIVAVPSSAAAGKLKVEQVKVLSSTCAR